MKPKGKILSLLLAICLIVGLLPTMALAADGDKTIMLGASQLQGRQASQVYFGTYQQSSDGSGGYNVDPVKWRVLSNADAQLFLVSDQNLDARQYHTDSESVTWETSTMRSWLNGYDASQNTGGDSGYDYTEDNFIDTAFSEKEQGAIAETLVTDSDNTDYGTDGGNDTTDRIFLLSLRELINRNYFPNYGLSTNTEYVAGLRGMNEAGESDRWWLRSPGYYNDYAAFIEDDGSANTDGNPVTDGATAVRPAFNLDGNAVLFTSAAAGGKAGDGELTAVEDYTGKDWKLTLLDNSRNFEISDAATNGSSDTIAFSYSGAQTGENEYVSAVIVDNGAITYYGRILQLDGAANGASGVASLTLPDGVTLSGTTKLYVFNEQYNGGENDDTRLTDYASKLIEVANPTVDETAPTLTAGEVSRDSEAAATVKFTSSEAGTYYYTVVESGVEAPDIETSGTGTACDTTEQIISLNSLSGMGAKDIYIVAKDAVGNVSEILSLTIPAAVYSISASPTELDFGRKTVGYPEAPAAQEVTITNMGNQTVTVNLPASVDYSITAGAGFADGAATLEPNGTAVFTVQPMTGLDVGSYDKPLVVSGTNGVNATVRLYYTVTQRSASDVSTYSVTVDASEHGTVTSSVSRAGCNTTVTLTAAADAGYELKSLTVTDSSGSVVKTTDQGGGMFTFVMPASNVTVKAVFLPDYAACDGGSACPLADYADLDTGTWYHDGIHYCLANGLMIGTGENIFSPDGTLTRAQAVTVLWRLEGEPIVDYEMKFADVAEGQWYSEAVRWAASEQIVEGYSDTVFGRDDAITREQLAAILYRYAAYKGYDVSSEGDVGAFTDASEISDWAYAAMQWACGTGLMEGNGDGTINPTGDTRRCEFATMVMRFAENIAE